MEPPATVPEAPANGASFDGGSEVVDDVQLAPAVLTTASVVVVSVAPSIVAVVVEASGARTGSSAGGNGVDVFGIACDGCDVARRAVIAFSDAVAIAVVVSVPIAVCYHHIDRSWISRVEGDLARIDAEISVARAALTVLRLHGRRRRAVTVRCDRWGLHGLSSDVHNDS